MAANLKLATAFVDLSLKGMSAVMTGLNTMRNKLQGWVGPLADNFQSAQSAVLGFVGAASPQAMGTFQGSIRLVSAAIGTALIPHIIEASRWIQKMAQYIRDMSPETKQQIADWVKWGVVVMGAVYAFTKLNGIISMIVANPLAATFLAVSAAILKVNADMDKMISKMNEAVDVMKRMKEGVFTEGEYKRSAAAAIEEDESLSPEEKMKQAKAARDRLTAEVKAQSKEGIGRGNLGSTLDYGLGALGITNKTDELQGSIQQKLKEAGMLDNLIKRLGTGAKPKFTDPSELNKGKGSDLLMAGAGVGGGGGGAMSLENAFMANAQAALAQDEISQKILQAQLEGNDVARKAAASQEQTAQSLKRMQQP